MKLVYQTKFGGSADPESEQGDCMRACIASIFEVDLDEAPDFVGEIENSTWFFHLERWLADRNLGLLMVRMPAYDTPGGFVMAAVDSEKLPEGDGHMVVFKDGQLAHDPNPRTERGPDDYKVLEYWAFTALDPSKAVPA